MAEVQTGDLMEESGNAYKCRVTLLASPNKRDALESIIASLMDWVDPSRQIVDVDEKAPGEKLYKGGIIQPDITGCLVTPAISIMLFAKETGEMCVSDIQRALHSPPWQFHHKVELQNKNAPNKPVAKQEFYRLTNDLPLFAACPVLTNTEHLRINLYVHDFPAMVDFYRTITETEIETSKPEFCIFELYRQPGLDIQLSLKHSPYLFPVPVESAYISFNVKSIEAVRVATHSAKIEYVGGNVYTTHDPDGNLVILYENDQSTQALYCNITNAVGNQTLVSAKCVSCIKSKMSKFLFDDGKSQQSVAESHDSGQFSDPEGNRIVRANGGKNSNSLRNYIGASGSKREKSEGYASSDSSSSVAPVRNVVATDRPSGRSMKSTGQMTNVGNLRDTVAAADKTNRLSDKKSGGVDKRYGLDNNGTSDKTASPVTNGSQSRSSANKLVRSKVLNSISSQHMPVYI